MIREDDLIILPAAERDIVEAFDWYERRLAGLGNDFLLRLDERFTAICDDPERFSIVHRGVRRALMRRFPFGIFYLVDGEKINVLAVLHASRDPQIWQGRI